VECAQRFSELEGPPGSPEAVARGCTCDPWTNRAGKGEGTFEGVIFHPDWRCPLHGKPEIANLPRIYRGGRC